MPALISRASYASMYGPTTGDRLRLGDTELIVEVDRDVAIGLAIAAAGPGDTVVIAGKGHEQGQEFEDGRKIPFDDREAARRHLGKAG